jgi:hypothetical protein
MTDTAIPIPDDAQARMDDITDAIVGAVANALAPVVPETQSEET